MTPSTSPLLLALFLAAPLALSGCIFDIDAGGTGASGGAGGQGASGGQGGQTTTGGSGGQGGQTTTGGSGGQGGQTTTGGSGGQGGGTACGQHADCPGGVCVFSTGQCAESCVPDPCAGIPGCGACSEGTVCDGCATASCADCDDCIGACVPEPAGCQVHEDCPSGQLCVFSTGTCADACGPGGTCGPGEVCVGCGTASCQLCADCLGVCLPAAGACDEHADCPGGLCQFSTGECIQACSAMDACPAGFDCAGCATASCPDCDDCLSGCVPSEQSCGGVVCPAGQACVWQWQMCMPTCTSPGSCANGDVCVECLTGSCPNCDDCVDICLAPP